MVERLLPPPDKYASWPNEGRLLEYYKGQFDSVFILLHPFILPRYIDKKRFFKRPPPTKHEIIQGCEAVTWAKILKLTGLKNLSEIDVGLRTYIGGLSKQFENKGFKESLLKIEKENGILLPEEGALPEHLENNLLESIKLLGYQWLWVGDEFGTIRKLYWIDDLIEKEEIHGHSAVFTHDHCLLLANHWDSHCTFLCSSKEIIEKILAVRSFEGFYCTPKTEVYWGLHEI